MDVSIIILNWNSKEWLQKCLTSLRGISVSVSFEIIVVDNATYDGCAEMLQRNFPQVIFVQSAQNLGFSRGNNLGAQKASGRNLLFLNPDTEFIEDAISTLVSQIDTLPQAGAVGARLLNPDRTLQTTCIQAFPTVLNQFLDSNYLRRAFPRCKLWGTSAFLSRNWDPEVVDAVTGACVMIKREVFEKIGGWTEAYFMYGEDLDFSYKVHRAGYRVYYVPQAALIHYGGTSTQKAESNFPIVMVRESVYKFFRIRRGILAAEGYRVAMTFSSIIRLLMLTPVLLLGSHKSTNGGRAVRKWFSILRWSLGLEAAPKL